MGYGKHTGNLTAAYQRWGGLADGVPALVTIVTGQAGGHGALRCARTRVRGSSSEGDFGRPLLNKGAAVEDSQGFGGRDVEYVARILLGLVAAIAGAATAIASDRAWIRILAIIISILGAAAALLMVGRLVLLKGMINVAERISAKIDREVAEETARRESAPSGDADPNARHRKPGPPVEPPG